MSHYWDKDQARERVERDGWLWAVLYGAEIGSCSDGRLQRLAMLVLVLADRVEELEKKQ